MIDIQEESIMNRNEFLKKLGYGVTASSLFPVITRRFDFPTHRSSSKKKFKIQEVPAPMFDDPIWHGAADPTIIWNHQENRWFVYYTQRRASLKNAEGVNWCHGSAIGICSSEDGSNWQYEGICMGDDGLNDPIGKQCSWWAPGVDYSESEQLYHMYVTWVDGIYTSWKGKRFIKHFTSKDGKNWQYQSSLDLSSDRCIDAGIHKIGNKWYLWYKDENKGSHTWMAESPDRYQWSVVGPVITDCGHEAPYVWHWQGNYWMIVDAWEKGLRIYKSQSGIANWQYSSTILKQPGKRAKDNARGDHPGILKLNNRVYILYFVHFRDKNENPEGRKTVLQAAELEYNNHKIVCNRDKFAT